MPQKSSPDTTPSHAATMSDCLRGWAVTRPEAAAVDAPDGSVSYGELDRLVDDYACALLASGAQPGDRFAVLAPNGIPLIAAHFAASRTSTILAGLNWRLTAYEISAILTDCRPRLTLVAPDLRHLIAEDAPAGALIEIGTDHWARWLTVGEDRQAHGAPGPDDVTMLLYTNGTTGVPKGVLLTDLNIMTMLREVGRQWGYSPESHLLGILPLFHIGATGTIISMLAAGGTVTLPADAKAETFVRIVEQKGITHSALVPTVLNDIVHLPGIADADLSRLQGMVYGAAPAGGSVIGQAMALMPQCGFTQAYGLTESTGSIAIAPMLRHGDPDDKPGTVGRAVPHYEIKVVDPASFERLPADTPGEIWIRGAQNAAGYWERPEETAEAFLPDGWFRTGDIGQLDADGYLFIKDRLKDLIITGGENVYSAEVEGALAAHPEVREAAVIGVPDERWGETVKAVVVLTDGSRLTSDDLREYARGRLAGYKVPRAFDFVAALPRSSTGKIQKRDLRH